MTEISKCPKCGSEYVYFDGSLYVKQLMRTVLTWWLFVHILRKSILFVLEQAWIENST